MISITRHADLGASFGAAHRVATKARRDSEGPGRPLADVRLPPGFTARVGEMSSPDTCLLVAPVEVVFDRPGGPVRVFAGEVVITVGRGGCASVALDGSITPAPVDAVDEGLVGLALDDAFAEAVVRFEREALAVDALIGVPV